jgi:hypothetical protein
MTATRIIYYLIALGFTAIVVILFFAQEGLLPKVTDKVDTSSFLNITQGTVANKGEKPTLSYEHREQIDSLQKAMEEMAKSKKNNCFSNYDGFSPLGEKGTSLKIQYDQREKATYVTIFGGVGGEQTVVDASFKVENIRPCVIAGSNTITENFYNGYIEGRSYSGPLPAYPYFQPVDSITIKGDEDENTIGVPALGGDAVNDENGNLKDGGWLYKVDDKFCFLPTIWEYDPTGDYDEDGMDSSYISGDEAKSLSKRKDQPDFPYCK